MVEDNTFYARDVQEWRKWLSKNHTKEKKIGLICYKKHTGKPSLSHQEAMHEAICFGWIDTTIKRLDDEKYVRYFARRSKNSKWSDATLGYAKRLIKEKRMAPEGLKWYKEGLGKPTHDHGIPKNPEMPEDFKQALERDKKARENFGKLTPSYKRIYFRWILKAKRPETRSKRIDSAVSKLRENQDLF
ncbi:MAG: YdeI/OmpD-associated family protein [Nanoarchaeota archaeon]|nr:YdeI/OmpD-associated family protein [Nanoarchaeota archaeon]